MPTRLLLAFAAARALHVPRRPAPAPAAVGRRAALAAATLILPKRATAEEAKNEVAPGTDEFLAAAGLKKKTVSKAFGESLLALMTKLRGTEHHYIRCLKPNQTLKAADWDNDFMFKQLSYSGTLEVTEIRKAGLNVRRPLAHFYRYYKICADDQTMLRAGTVRVGW